MILQYECLMFEPHQLKLLGQTTFVTLACISAESVSHVLHAIMHHQKVIK